MENIKEELKNVISEVMLPETQGYLEELEKVIDEHGSSSDEREAKADMEAFVAELQTILTVIETNEISDEDAKHVYEKIMQMLEEHSTENINE